MGPRGGGAQGGPTRERGDGGLKGKEGSKAKQSKAKRSKAKQSEAKRSEAKQATQNKAKQSKAKRSEAKQSEAKQSEAKQSEAKQSKQATRGGGDPKGLGWGPAGGGRQFEYIKSSFSLLENAISGPEPAGRLSRALNGWISAFGAADNSNT